jgi:hypothetical protein
MIKQQIKIFTGLPTEVEKLTNDFLSTIGTNCLNIQTISDSSPNLIGDTRLTITILYQIVETSSNNDINKENIDRLILPNDGKFSIEITLRSPINTLTCKTYDFNSKKHLENWIHSMEGKGFKISGMSNVEKQIKWQK